jgi:hypothetical protein
MPAALNPELMALVQPWRDFVSQGLITAINAVFTPGGTNVTVTVSDSVKLPEGTVRGPLAPGVAKEAIFRMGLGKKKNKSTSSNDQPLPIRSLCIKDAEEEDKKKVLSRILDVVKAVGPTVAAGRIGSLRIYVEGCDTFEKWWKKSDPSMKVRLLSTEKHFKALSEEHISRIGEVLPEKSPFLGSVPTPQEEEQKSSETKESSKDVAKTSSSSKSRKK